MTHRLVAAVSLPLALLGFSLVSPAAADIPTCLPYGGTIDASAGEVHAANLTFRLLRHEGGEFVELWHETHEGAPVVLRRFNVCLNGQDGVRDTPLDWEWFRDGC